MGKSNHLNIDRIAFIGRTYSEYMSMFGLNEGILKQGPVLDCPAGPSSFAAEAEKMGLDVTACDINYDLEIEELLKRGKNDIAHVFDKFDEVSHLYTWEYYKSKHEVISLRNNSMELFIGDFTRGFAEGRYRKAELPSLPFSDGAFSLVLSGHFLFLYGNRLDYDFHRECIRELVRVCSGEVRIFPLTGLDAKPCSYLGDICSFLKSGGITVEIINVPFEFQIGGNRMMRLYRKM